MIASVLILVVLSLPLFDMQARPGGRRPVARGHDGPPGLRRDAQGFGDGANGPFLIAVKLDPPAHNDQKKLNKLNDQIAAQQQQAEQQVDAQATQIATS